MASPVAYQIIGWILCTLDVIIYYIQLLIYGNDARPLELRDGVTGPGSFHTDEETDKNESKVYRNIYLKDRKRTKLDDGIITLDQQFNHAVKKYAQLECMGYREIVKVEKKVIEGKVVELPEFKENMKWLTYEQVGNRVRDFSTGLVEFTMLNSGDKLAIYENTCLEWQLTAQSCIRYGITIVTVYSSLGQAAIISSLNQTEITALMIGEDLLPNLAGIANGVPTLKYVIYNPSKFYPNTFQLESLPSHLKVLSVAEVEKMGSLTKEPPKVKAPPRESDVALIMYTSGTTGEPKGVMHTHRSVLAMVGRHDEEVTPSFPVDVKKPVHLAYLPIAHILEFIAEGTIMNFGGAIGFGSPKTLSDRVCKPCGDLKAVKPNTLFGVPRVYETLKKLTWELVNDSSTKPIRRYLFNLAYNFKKEAIKNGRQTPLFNKLIFAKTKQAIGGNTSVIMSGGAPLNPDTQEFLRICFDAVVCQGYGLTETGVVSVQRKNRPMTVGNVGQLSFYADVKLRSVPEMNYTIHDKPFPRGEVLIRGEAVCDGYYKRPDLTNEAIKDGWFHSGDIGYIDDLGFLHIIDRKKNVVKLDHGEYVAIERLEGVYQNSPFVSPNGIYVHADPSKSFVVANILPQLSYLKMWASQNHIHESDMQKLCEDIRVRKAVLEALHQEAKKADFARFEYLGDIRLHVDEWTPENGMLTAAMKHQRRSMYIRYEKHIKEMYGQ